MVASLRVLPGSSSAMVTCTGSLALGDAMQAARQLWQHPDWGGRVVVWDLRAASFDVSSPEVRELARFVLENQPVPPPRRVALVTERDVDFGLARMFEMWRDDPATELRVFRDVDEALAWGAVAAPLP